MHFKQSYNLLGLTHIQAKKMPVCLANSLKYDPHLQKRVLWEEGTGVSIRSHTQQ